MHARSDHLALPSRPRSWSRLLLGVSALLFAVARAQSPSEPSKLFGRVLDRITCEADETQSYALYVPSTYSVEKKWPAIFCFDPSARGLIPVERLKVAAEKYGYIVAASLNSRNGPWAQNAAAADAMVRDVTTHFSVDRERIYTVGMSGGARVATSIAMSGVAKGVIACGAGFPVLPGGIPKQVSFAFFGVAGVEDFNYAELQRLDTDLADRKAVHRIISFPGGHIWAPATILTEGVEWLEVQAMRTGTRSKDDALIETLFRTRLAKVPTSPELERWKALQSLVTDFDGLVDTTPFAKEVAALASTRAVKDELKTERRWLIREDELLSELGNTATAGAERKLSLAKELRRKADAPQDSAERRMIRRAIASYSSMARETARGFFEQKDYDNAEAYLEFGVALRPDHKAVWFDLARAHAFNGNRKRALESLEQAVVVGYSNTAQAESEPAFAKLRSDPRFQTALEKMRVEAANPTMKLPSMRVSAAFASVELRLHHLPFSGGGVPSLAYLRVETVRADSRAARAGLKEGMEVTAVQGLGIRGLTEIELNDTMSWPVKNEIVLVAREPHGPEKEIHIPLRTTPVAETAE